MTTVEGYVYVITVEGIQYMGNEDSLPEVPKVDLTEGKIGVTIDKESWTNDKIKVTIQNKLSGAYELYYSYDTVNWTKYETPLEITEKKAIHIRLRDALGNSGQYATYTINKIDKLAPIKFNPTVTVTTNSITIDASLARDAEATTQYGKSDIKEIAYSNDDGTTWHTNEENKTATTYTFTGLTQQTGYKVKVKVTDNAENEMITDVQLVTTEKQLVTNITLTPTNKEIKPDETFTLTANVEPNDAYNKGITWSTSSSGIASISGTSGGSITVTGKSAGSATITATAQDGSGKKATCEVTVKNNVLAKQITASNYGDYVDYPVSIGRGPAGIAETHKTDWRIFYNDGTYVYLIASYLLLNSQRPTETGMTSYSGQPYSSYWKDSLPSIEMESTVVARKHYLMSWNKSNSIENIRCVLELLDTSIWSKFANTTYAEDAVGAPTLEMWVESWNATGGTTLYCNNSNNSGYYVGTITSPTTLSVNVSNSNSLYFPVRNASDANGYRYWLASPSASQNYRLVGVYDSGSVNFSNYGNYSMSVRPLVRLKSTVSGTLKDGIWTLK